MNDPSKHEEFFTRTLIKEIRNGADAATQQGIIAELLRVGACPQRINKAIKASGGKILVIGQEIRQ